MDPRSEFQSEQAKGEASEALDGARSFILVTVNRAGIIKMSRDITTDEDEMTFFGQTLYQHERIRNMIIKKSELDEDQESRGG